MVMDYQERTWLVHAQIRNADAVYVLGPFNNWSTIATPMTEVEPGLWEVCLPAGQVPQPICYFVWELGRRFGRLVQPASVASSAAGHSCDAHTAVHRNWSSRFPFTMHVP